MMKRWFHTSSWGVLAVALLVAACGTDGGPTEPGDSNNDENTAPVANAGADQEVVVGATVTLDGSQSSDADGDNLTYAWAFVSRPTGSSASLTNTSSVGSSFTPDVEGEYGVELTVSDGTDSAKDTVTVTATVNPNLPSSITADTTLPDIGVPYIASGNIGVSAALTIEPGVTVEFAQGARLQIQSGGSLTAVGTETDTIRFLGQDTTAGYWDGIEFVSNSPDNELTYVEVAHGGSSDWSNVYVQSGAQVKITNSLLRDGSNYGAYVEAGAALSGFASNEFKGNDPTALRIPAHEIGAVDGASTYASGNTKDYITVKGTKVTEPQTWPKTDAPFYVTGNTTLEAAVTVDPGARFLFGQAVRVIVSSTGPGSLTAVGTSTDTISFMGEQATAGYWDGIEFVSNSTANELTYAEVAHGGADGWSNVYVQSGAQVKITNSLLRDGSNYGAYVEADAALSGFASNEFKGNDPTALRIPAHEIGAVDGASTYASGNTKDYITVKGTKVTEPQTWPKTDAPFYVTGNTTLEAAVTVDPGARFLFGQAVRLTVSSTGPGSLTAVGTSTDTISFVGEQATAGYWDGIEFVSNSTDNKLRYVNVGHGGADGMATLYVQDTGQLSVTDSEIHHSSTCGIIAETGATLNENGNDFHDNAGSCNVQQ